MKWFLFWSVGTLPTTQYSTIYKKIRKTQRERENPGKPTWKKAGFLSDTKFRHKHGNNFLDNLLIRWVKNP